ncbi:response regulator transcription factor [Streptomyces sp. NPDC094448]|uniref:response regulator transcription factor n=1 Tax=Streptomyces sp. NPDC094448 TaxID=3366063 RepID=UPI0037FF8057
MANSVPMLVDLAQTMAQDIAADPTGPADEHPLFRRPGLTMACLDRNLTVQQGNHEFFGRFGGDTAQPCGRPFTDLVHPSVQQPLLRKFAGLTEGKRDRFTSEVLAVGPDGRAFTASLSACAVRSGTPDVSAIWVMMASDSEPVDTDVMPSRKKMLSEIDARILEGIAAGVSTVPLAARLYLSRQGVEYHVTCLFRKLRVPNRAALVSRAYSMGVLKVGMWPPKVVEDFVK